MLKIVVGKKRSKTMNNQKNIGNRGYKGLIRSSELGFLLFYRSES